MNARQLAILVLVAVIAACNTSEPTKPAPVPVPLEIPVEPPLDTSTLEVETSAPISLVPKAQARKGNGR
jgi:predicted component of type VI protein secretion system